MPPPPGATRGNQLRVLMTAAAYVLMQELRLRAARTACARAQVTWLRDRLLKLGAHVVVSFRRMVLHLPRSTPDRDAWQLRGHDDRFGIQCLGRCMPRP